MENFLIFISENIKILKPRARSKTVSGVGWMAAWMDSIPNFGLARWLFCLEDMAPMGVAGLLNRPCLGTVECTIRESWLNRLPIENVSGHPCVDRGQAKASTSGPEIYVNLGVKEKLLFFLQGLIGQLSLCWNSQTLLCICIQPA